MERVLQEVLYTPAHRGFSFVIGSKALNNALKEFEKEPKYQRLVIDFEQGEDPDGAFSSIPYEKGANLILLLGKYLDLVLAAFYLILLHRAHTGRA